MDRALPLHTNRRYDAHLTRLRQEVLAMGNLVDEQIGDHAANIAEAVVFMVEGRDICQRALGGRYSPSA